MLHAVGIASPSIEAPGHRLHAVIVDINQHTAVKLLPKLLVLSLQSISSQTRVTATRAQNCHSLEIGVVS